MQPIYNKLAKNNLLNYKLIITNMYKCKVCGHIYDEAQGDPDNGIPAGTPFEDLPDDWRCPICQVEKEYYEKIES